MIYRAQVEINRVVNGKMNSEVIEYEFSKGTALGNRREAIKKLKDYSLIFQGAHNEGTDDFASPDEVIDGKLKNWNCYSLMLSYELDGEECEVFGMCGSDADEFYELLDYECNEFIIMGIDSKAFEVIEFEGSSYRVLTEDLIFLMTA